MSEHQTAPGGMLGQLLRGHRQAVGLSQEELAEKAGVSVRTIANIEHGRISRPHRRSVLSLADALRLTQPDRDLLDRASRQLANGRVAPAVVASAMVAPAVVPRQLPAAPSHFAGRSGELAALARLLDDRASPARTVLISVIGGTAGIGKTALALHWAHRVADRFADGQLYVNLRGFGPSGPPMRPGEALRGFLNALGVPADRVPAAESAQGALYRSVLARRSMLIVLDNARDADQVRPLLPGSPTCVVVITSRSQMIGLMAADNARPLHLNVLTPADGLELLTRRLGSQRLAADPQAALDLVTLCARLPLALAIVAGRAAANPALTLRHLAGDLRAEAPRLDALDTGEAATSLRTVLSWSYQELSGQAARMFRLLGLHSGPDIAVAAAAALAGQTRQQARRLLAELTASQVLAEHAPGRFTCHDLLRAYAAEQTARCDGPADRRAAVGRMLDYYLHSAHRAAQALDPTRCPFSLPPERPGTEAEHFPDSGQALAWLRTERQALLAAARLAATWKLDSYVWQIPLALTDYLDRHGHWAEAASAYEASVTAARRLGDHAAQARMLRYLGEAKGRLGRPEEAYRDLTQALAMRDELGDLEGKAICHVDLSWVFELKGDLIQALHHGRVALSIFIATGQRKQQAAALNRLGWYQAHLGSYAEALTSCKQALEISVELGDQHGQAAALDSIGYAYHHLGNHEAAVRYYNETLEMVVELHEPYHEAVVLDHLGDAHAADGDLAQAGRDWERALTRLDSLHHPDADQVRAKLADTEEMHEHVYERQRCDADDRGSAGE